MACRSSSSSVAGHKQRLHVDRRPTVLSAEYFQGILSRSRQAEQKEALALIQEEQRHKQYLQDAGEALCKKFTNYDSHQLKEPDVLQVEKDRALAEKTKDHWIETQLELKRKERIYRANQILHLLKPGPRMLHAALRQSELIFQQGHNETIKQDIAKEAEQQRQLEQQQCPEILIPFGRVTEAQEQQQQLEKSLKIRADCLKDMEERRLQKAVQKQQERENALVELKHFESLQDKEQEAVKELTTRKRESCIAAYKDALKQKADLAKFDRICEQLDERVRCVSRVTQKSLKDHCQKQQLKQLATQVKTREARAAAVCGIRETEKHRNLQEDAYATKLLQKEADLKAERAALVKARQAYQIEEARQREERKQKSLELRRFELATRLKNATANAYHKKDNETLKINIKAALRQTLSDQRNEALQRHSAELIKMTTPEDPHLRDDVAFFEDALELMKHSQELGRPLYPLAKAVQSYQHVNQLDMVPMGQLPARDNKRDACWPGYISKAQLAYSKYAHVQQCRKEQEPQRQRILDSCLKITQLAANENPLGDCSKSKSIPCLRNSPVKSETNSSLTKPPLKPILKKKVDADTAISEQSSYRLAAGMESKKSIDKLIVPKSGATQKISHLEETTCLKLAYPSAKATAAIKTPRKGPQKPCVPTPDLTRYVTAPRQRLERKTVQEPRQFYKFPSTQLKETRNRFTELKNQKEIY